VTIPAASRATLAFWIRIDSAETTTTVAYDRLSVQVVTGGATTTLATYSNLNENTTYVQRMFDLSAFTGGRSPSGSPALRMRACRPASSSTTPR
jgi:hypothetical protein